MRKGGHEHGSALGLVPKLLYMRFHGLGHTVEILAKLAYLIPLCNRYTVAVYAVCNEGGVCL